VTNSGSLFYFDSFGPAKKVRLSFGNIAPTSLSVVRTSTQTPSYNLNLNGSAAGQCWLYFDTGLKDFELSVSISPPPGNQPIFAKLTWPINTTNIGQITINTTSRTLSYIARTTNPQSAERGLYADGERWVAGANNIPLSNWAIVLEVLQAESQLSFGNDYFITLAQPADIESDNLTVNLKNIKSFARRAATNSYTIYDTKVNPALSPSGTAAQKVFVSIPNGEVIYISLEKSTGIPAIDTTFNSATHYQIAYAEVDGSVTDLADVTWIIVNNLGGITQLVEDQAQSIRALYTTGFFNKVVFEETAVANSFRLTGNIFNLYGNLVIVPTTLIDLGAPPGSGARRDFVYMEIKKQSVPWTTITYEFKVINNGVLNNITYPDPFAQPGLIQNDDSNEYTYDQNGYYKAVDSTNEVDGYSYAVPIALVHRFNSNAYNISSNRNGAGSSSRVDGKSPTILNLDEIENRAPKARKPEYNYAIKSAVRKILRGELNNRLQPSLTDATIFSRSPFQIDVLSSGSEPSGTNFIGKRDDIRYFWGNDQARQVLLYGIINKSADSGVAPYNSPALSFDNATKDLHIQIPTSTEGLLVLDEFNQPIITARWVTTGAAVKFVNTTWLTELSDRVMVNTVDSSDADYIAAGNEFVVTFLVTYNDSERVGLSAVPASLISAAIDNDYAALANSYAIATENFNNNQFIKNLTTSVTIATVPYPAKLYLQPAGDNFKFYTYQMHYVKNRQPLNPYVIPDTINEPEGTYSILGVVEARKVADNSLLKIDTITYSGGNFNVTLTDNTLIPVNTPIKFVLGCGGGANKQIDLEVGSLSIKNLTQSLTGQIISDGVDGFYRYAGNNASPIKGRLIYGFSSARFIDEDSLQFMAFVGEDLVPVVVNGLGTNLISIDFSQDDISNFTSGNWTSDVPATAPYYPDNGVTLQFGLLISNRLDDNLYLQYQYNSLPFIPFQPSSGDNAYKDYLSDPRLPYDSGDKAVVVHTGVLLLSTDGIANPKGSIASPISERLPAVQDITIIGQEVEPTTGLSDIFTSGIQQLQDLIFEGIPITFDNNIALGINVDAGKSVAAWFALIKQVNLLRLFLFEVREGQFVLNEDSIPQAFVCELEENYREVYK
jgi:hypothetical protein